MSEKLTSALVAGKTLSELERERGIVGTVCDLSRRYLGLPPSKKFYRKAEIDFQKTRAEFDKVAKRLGVKADVD